MLEAKNHAKCFRVRQKLKPILQPSQRIPRATVTHTANAHPTHRLRLCHAVPMYIGTARQTFIILRATVIRNAPAYLTRPQYPRVVMPAAGEKSSRPANAPMRKGARSTVRCCILSRPLRIEPRHIPATSPFSLAHVYLYPGSSVWMPSTPQGYAFNRCSFLLRRGLRRTRKRPDNHT